MPVSDKEGNTQLHFAAATGNSQTIDDALKSGDAVNGQNKLGQTALHIAYKHNRIENATHLIRRGASLKILDQEGKSPADYDTSGL